VKGLAVDVIAILLASAPQQAHACAMPSAEIIQSRYTAEELTELRRNTLRYARSFPPGNERNRHRLIAASLRTLFKSEGWLKAHTLDGPLVP
jgi:hypothetical protein